MDVPLVELRDDVGNAQVAPSSRVALGIPVGRLRAVTEHKGEVYGLLGQRHAIPNDDDEDGPASYTSTELWILQLRQIDEGMFAWDDLQPDKCKTCTSCVLPYMEEGPCPVCNRKSLCYHFRCPFDCPDRAEERTRYCGSAPFFWGSGFGNEEKKATFGPDSIPRQLRAIACLSGSRAMFSFRDEETPDFASDFVLTFDGREADIFVDGDRCESMSLRALVPNFGQPIVRALPPIVDGDLEEVSSAVVLATYYDHERDDTYFLVERQCFEVWKKTRSEHFSPSIGWADRAQVPSEPAWESGFAKSFHNRIVKVNSHLLIALSECGLWALDIPGISRETTAATLAQQLSWRQVLRLPKEFEDDIRLSSVGESLQFARGRHRLLACGPRPNQIIIFTGDRCDVMRIRPRLLVQFDVEQKSVSAMLHLSSTIPIPLEAGRAQLHGRPHRLLPSVLRLRGSRRGYLFSNRLGEIFHLRDESIVPAECGWQLPNWALMHNLHPCVTFKFPQDGEDAQVRVSPTCPLLQLDYFEKLLGSWQEASTAEVIVTDIDPQTFDNLLLYINAGILGAGLSIGELIALVRAASKYLVKGLLSMAVARLLDMLEMRQHVQALDVKTAVQLVSLPEDVRQIYPELQKNIMEAVALHRSRIITDESFLKQVVAVDSSSLASLIVAIHGNDINIDDEGSRSRRHRRLEISSRLWRTNFLGMLFGNDASHAVSWSALHEGEQVQGLRNRSRSPKRTPARGAA